MRHGSFLSADRGRLEKLCRYIARPPIANERLERLADGRIAYRLKRVWSDGTSAIVLEPMDLVARLLPLVPPPRSNQIRFHGVLAPAASWRDQVVPGGSRRDKPARRKNYCWAELMRRVFELDVLVCPTCGGQMRVEGPVNDRETIRAMLGAAGLSADSPPRTPARDFCDWSAA